MASLCEIYVSTPNFWWRAPVAYVRRLVPADPDADDGHQRWVDRGAQRWHLIASAVSRVSEALAEGAWKPDDERSHGSHGVVKIDVSELNATELKIAWSWFRHAEAVRADPWFEPLTNGRHRLWATLNSFGSEPVPIASDALLYANAQDVAVLGPKWSQSYAANLEDLLAIDWFDRSDPVNVRFVRSLVTAARGEIPVPV